jgi:quercetin dioxygenase-like cupin family protein
MTMKHVHYSEVAAKEVTDAGARDVRVRWLVSREDGAPNFYMRRFELAAGGCTPRHAHPWEHEVYILEGEGVVFGGGAEEEFRAGDVIFVPSDEEHYFAASPNRSVAFLCLVPKGALGCGVSPAKK